jgi:hypothetical protein
MGALLGAVASGSVTPCEASEVAKVVAGYRDAPPGERAPVGL